MLTVLAKEKTLLRYAYALALATVIGISTMPAAAEEVEDKAPVFTEEFLNDPAVLAKGRDIWHEQCQHCHGKNAYPGKAPRLKPRKYTPDFVYRRVTKGFRGMPSWVDVYDRQERMSVAAWVMNKDFSN